MTSHLSGPILSASPGVCIVAARSGGGYFLFCFESYTKCAKLLK